MKNILKLSIVSLCASGAVFSTQANQGSQSASNTESDKQLVVTEPAGADSSPSVSTTSQTWQSGYQPGYRSGTTYQSGSAMQTSSGRVINEAAGAGAPGVVTGRDQDCYADCILHRYQKGKGAARVTDEHYWNNVPADRIYAQYPGSGAMYQNFAYTSYSQPASSSSQWSSSSQPSSAYSSQTGQIWYGPDGKMYGSATSMTPLSGSAAQSSSSFQSSQNVQESSGAAQSSATQPSTSGAQSSTELKSSQNQPGTATQESAGAQPSPSSSSTDTSTQPSTSSTSPDQSSTQSSTSTSTSAQDMTDKVRSTLKSDTTLSPLASNVTVQDQNGKVALNGTVKSEAEKQQIVSKAEEIAGSGNVIDNLEIKSDSSSGNNSNSTP